MINAHTILTLLLPLMAFHGNKANPLTQFIILRGHGQSYKPEKIQRMQDLEYPRNDCEILRVLYEMWGNYYACLLEKENQETKPEIRRLLEGQSTSLKCDYCEKPFQNSFEIQWKYKPLSTKANITQLQYLDLTPEMALTKNKLQIYNANQRFSGLYVCFHGQNVLSMYILEVSKNDTAVQVKDIESKTEKIKILGRNFNVHYQWTNFTKCSTCGKVGKKYRYGICYVSLSNVNERSNLYKTNSTERERSLSKNFSRSKKYIYQRNKLFKVGENSTSQVYKERIRPGIFKRFRNGIPCASPYLNNMDYDFINNFPAVKVFVTYCLEHCEEEKIFEVIDSKGRVVEIANNSAGIYSLFQELPNIPLGTQRSTVVARFGSDIVIQCPGTARTNTPVVWKINDKIIHPEIVNRLSNGRFTIDFTNRIHIKKLRLKDSQIYSCWQNDELVGTVHLNVDKKFGISFNHHVTLIGIAIIISTLLVLGSKILTRELSMRKK